MVFVRLSTVAMDKVVEQLEIIDQQINTNASKQGNHYFAKRVLNEMANNLSDFRMESNIKSKSYKNSVTQNKTVGDNGIDDDFFNKLVTLQKIDLLNNLLPERSQIHMEEISHTINNKNITDNPDLVECEISKDAWDNYKRVIIENASDLHKELSILKANGLDDSEMFYLKNELFNEIKNEARFIKQSEQHPSYNEDGNKVKIRLPRSDINNPDLNIQERTLKLVSKSMAVSEVSEDISNNYYISKSDLSKMENVIKVNSKVLKDIDTNKVITRHYYKDQSLDGGVKVKYAESLKNAIISGFDKTVVTPARKLSNYLGNSNKDAIRLDKASKVMGYNGDPVNKSHFISKFINVNEKFISSVQSKLGINPKNEKEQIIEDYNRVKRNHIMTRTLHHLTPNTSEQKLGLQVLDQIIVDFEVPIKSLKSNDVVKTNTVNLSNDLDAYLTIADKLLNEKSHVKSLNPNKFNNQSYSEYSIPRSDIESYLENIKHIKDDQDSEIKILSKNGLANNPCLEVKKAVSYILNDEIKNVDLELTNQNSDPIVIKIPNSSDEGHPLNSKLKEFNHLKKVSDKLYEDVFDRNFSKNSELIKAQDILKTELTHLKSKEKVSRPNVEVLGTMDLSKDNISVTLEKPPINNEHRDFNFSDFTKKIAEDIKAGVIKTASFTTKNNIKSDRDKNVSSYNDHYFKPPTEPSLNL